MNFCQNCKKVTDLFLVEGVHYCKKCLLKKEVKDQQFHAPEEMIVENEPITKGILCGKYMTTSKLHYYAPILIISSIIITLDSSNSVIFFVNSTSYSSSQ